MSAICSLWKIYECLFIPNCTRKIIWLLVNNIQVTISVTLQYFTWQMEATSYVYFIGWKFDMWIQAWKLIHSLQVMYENWAVTVKSSVYSVELKNFTAKQRKMSLPLWCSFPARYFSSGWQTVCKNYWTWYKLLWPNYREMKLKSTKKRNLLALKESFFNFS